MYETASSFSCFNCLDIALATTTPQLLSHKPKYKKFILDKQCLKRQLKPSDVANLVLYLSSDVSSGCTKQNFIVDAGIT